MRYQREIEERLAKADDLLSEAQSMMQVDSRGLARSVSNVRNNLTAVRQRVRKAGE